MKADASRIEFVDYRSEAIPLSNALDEDGRLCERCLPSLCCSVRKGVRLTARESMSAEAFDIKLAQCSKEEDEERLLAAIEICGGGFDAFNAWMCKLIKSSNVRPLINHSRGLQRWPSSIAVL